MIIATGPVVLGARRLSWIVIGIALVAPWSVLAYMDRLLRRSR